jgi:hypothetical protein
MRLLSDIIEAEVVDKLDNRVKVNSAGVWDSVTKTQVVTLCNEKWLKLYGFVYNTLGTRLEVVSYNQNGTITLSVPDAPNAVAKGQNLTINRPVFFHGTWYNTTEEWIKFSEDERDKLPFIWLVYPVDEQFNEPQNAVERQSPARLVFVHWSDWLNSTNNDRMQDSVKPLTALVSEFIATIDRNRAIFRERQGFRMKSYPKFGTETERGIVAVFDSTLSAVEVDVNLSIFHKNSCIC